MSKKGTIDNPAEVKVYVTWKQVGELIEILNKHNIKWSMVSEPIYGDKKEDKNENNKSMD